MRTIRRQWRYNPSSGPIRHAIHWAGFCWAGITTLCVYYMAVSGVLLLISDARLPGILRTRVLQTQQADYLPDPWRIACGLFFLALVALAFRHPIPGAFAALATFGGLGMIDSVYHANGRGILFWAGFLVIGVVKQRERTLNPRWDDP